MEGELILTNRIHTFHASSFGGTHRFWNSYTSAIDVVSCSTSVFYHRPLLGASTHDSNVLAEHETSHGYDVLTLNIDLLL
jgi:hypothetical protein